MSDKLTRFGEMPASKEILEKMKFQVESRDIYLWCERYKQTESGSYVFENVLVTNKDDDSDKIVYAFYDSMELFNPMDRITIFSPAITLYRLIASLRNESKK